MTIRAAKPAAEIKTDAEDLTQAPPEAGGQNGPSTESPAEGNRDPLDHDGDGRKGGAAPPPAVAHLVVLSDDPARGLVHGEVIATADAHVKGLLADDVVRAATDTEVELAQPRVRPWSPPAA